MFSIFYRIYTYLYSQEIYINMSICILYLQHKYLQLSVIVDLDRVIRYLSDNRILITMATRQNLA